MELVSVTLQIYMDDSFEIFTIDKHHKDTYYVQIPML